jgi:hypothetical protein
VGVTPLAHLIFIGNAIVVPELAVVNSIKYSFNIVESLGVAKLIVKVVGVPVCL